MNYDEKTAIRKTRDFYEQKKDAPILQREFGFYSLERWIEEGHIKDLQELSNHCDFDASGTATLYGLGWCEAEFAPAFDTKILEDRGEHELIQDTAGRHVLCFKGRRSGFMPEYVSHPVTDRESWERDVKWRLDPKSPERQLNTKHVLFVQEMATKGAMVSQDVVGGYMYLRSLLGPEGALYMFYDDPDLLHDMMQSWLYLADAVIANHQTFAPLDELNMAEDICYKSGPLISPDMMREFLFPYYQQLISNIKTRQPGRFLHVQVDTDGDCRPVIPVYQEIGMTYLSPFEVASGCDVVALRKQYPELLMRGGFDKRIIAAGKDAIDREVERIMPFMKAQGGYIPTCDHGVPEEVSFENYVHFRRRLNEF